MGRIKTPMEWKDFYGVDKVLSTEQIVKKLATLLRLTELSGGGDMPLIHVLLLKELNSERVTCTSYRKRFQRERAARQARTAYFRQSIRPRAFEYKLAQ